jgi:GT2 family glycosyltransferase
VELLGEKLGTMSDACTSDSPAFIESPRIAAVILNYRTPALAVDCLASLEGEWRACPALVAVVVDNASGDDSADRIAAAIAGRGWSSWAWIVRAVENRGFSAGNNLGIRAVQADVYWLLNSDTIVRPGALRELLRALKERPDAGILSPRLEWPDGTPQQSCFRFLRPPTELVRTAGTRPVTEFLRKYEAALPVADSPIEPDWTTFASVLIRRSVFDRLGLLDEGYFMYYEDLDFCRRARQAGETVLHWPAARVVHLRGQSGNVKKATIERKRRPAYFYAARARYYAKFHGRLGLWAANLYWGVGRLIALARELVGNKDPHACQREARDIWINWRRPLAPFKPAGAS